MLVFLNDQIVYLSIVAYAHEQAPSCSLCKPLQIVDEIRLCENCDTGMDQQLFIFIEFAVLLAGVLGRGWVEGIIARVEPVYEAFQDVFGHGVELVALAVLRGSAGVGDVEGVALVLEEALVDVVFAGRVGGRESDDFGAAQETKRGVSTSLAFSVYGVRLGRGWKSYSQNCWEVMLKVLYV